MTILKAIEADILTARKEHLNDTLEVLKNLKAEILNFKISNKGKVSDSDIITITKREAKKNLDFMDFAVEAGRTDLVNLAVNKAEIYSKYLPKMLTEDEILDLLAEKGATKEMNMGQLIKLIMSTHKDVVDGKQVQEVVKKYLKN